MFDLLIRNAQVLDGTGAPAYLADVAVKDGRSPQSESSPARRPRPSTRRV